MTGLSEQERTHLAPFKAKCKCCYDADEVNMHAAIERIAAAREAALAERIAQAIEAAGTRRPRDPQWMWAADAAVAARLAREIGGTR